MDSVTAPPLLGLPNVRHLPRTRTVPSGSKVHACAVSSLQVYTWIGLPFVVRAPVSSTHLPCDPEEQRSRGQDPSLRGGNVGPAKLDLHLGPVASAGARVGQALSGGYALDFGELGRDPGLVRTAGAGP